MTTGRGDGATAIEARVRAGGLLAPGRPVVVLLSGGQDSVCLLDLAVRIAGAGAVAAVHVDYGLREAAADDVARCRSLCDALGVELVVHRPGRPGRGNLQAWARERRYAAAAALAERRGADVVTGHTASDQAETVLYRLAASPGRRALLGMRERDGRLARPLLAVSREETAAYCRERGLAFTTDETNSSRRYARNRVRLDLLGALREVHPAAESNVLRTLDVLRDEAAVLDAVLDAALDDAGDPPTAASLAALPPALARLAVQRLADRAMPDAPALGARAAEILGLAAAGGTATLDVGHGLRAVVSYGALRFERAGRTEAAAPGDALLDVPGTVAFAGGTLTCERGGDIPVGDGTLDADVLVSPLAVRGWRPGDRMRPLGLGGTKTVQDLFCDRKVPRGRRSRLPVVLSDGEIAWIPGVATGERFRVTERTGQRARLVWEGQE